MGIFCLTCIFLCVTFSGNCQEVQTSLTEKGDELFSIGRFNDAAISYERAIFLGLPGKATGFMKLKKAECYKQLNDFTRALQELESIFLPSMPDSVQDAVIYQKALCHYLNHQPQDAAESIQQLRFERASPDRMILEILIFSDLTQWEKARDRSILLIERFHGSKSSDSLVSLCHTIFDLKRQPKLKKEKTAALLSTFIPGAGQMYVGKPVRSLLAFSFTIGSVGIALFEVINGFYFTGYVTGLGFFQKFYFGGIEQSRRLAREQNSKRIEKYTSTIRDFIFSVQSNL
jgi:hypothetical protein